MKTISISKQEQQGTEILENKVGAAIGYTQKNPEKVGGNEDSILIHQPGEKSFLLAVADGMGGHRAADEASRIAVESLSKIKNPQNKNELRNMVIDAFESANDKVLSLGLGAGTTLSAVFCFNNLVRSIHVGDSTTLVTGKHGKLKFRNTLHSPIGYALESGFIEEDELEAADNPLVLNAIGSQDMKMELGPWIQLSPNDTLLISSDGLTDNMKLKEIKELIRIGSLQEAFDSIKEKSTSLMKESPIKPDDLSFVIYRTSLSE